jgi:hypothetical protein
MSKAEQLTTEVHHFRKLRSLIVHNEVFLFGNASMFPVETPQPRVSARTSSALPHPGPETPNVSD